MRGAVGGPRVDRGMVISGLPITDTGRRARARKNARHSLEGSISSDWNWCLLRPMRAVNLQCAVGRIEDHLDVVAAPRCLVARGRWDGSRHRQARRTRSEARAKDTLFAASLTPLAEARRF